MTTNPCCNRTHTDNPSQPFVPCTDPTSLRTYSVNPGKHLFWMCDHHSGGYGACVTKAA